MPEDFFPTRPSNPPIIYAYEDTNPIYNGLLKIGYTKGKSALDRVSRQYPTKRPGPSPFRIVLEEAEYNEEGNVTKEAVLGDYIFEVTYPSGYELPEIISLHTCKNIDELKAWIRGRGLDKQFDLRKSFQNLFNDVYEYLRSL